MSESKVDLYDQLIANHPKIDQKGRTMPYNSIRGHRFSFFAKDGLMRLYLAKKDLEEFIQRFKSNLEIQYGQDNVGIYSGARQFIKRLGTTIGIPGKRWLRFIDKVKGNLTII